jgi:hypothetical protein
MKITSKTEEVLNKQVNECKVTALIYNCLDVAEDERDTSTINQWES